MHIECAAHLRCRRQATFGLVLISFYRYGCQLREVTRDHACVLHWPLSTGSFRRFERQTPAWVFPEHGTAVDRKNTGKEIVLLHRFKFRDMYTPGHAHSKTECSIQWDPCGEEDSWLDEEDKGGVSSWLVNDPGRPEWAGGVEGNPQYVREEREPEGAQG